MRKVLGLIAAAAMLLPVGLAASPAGAVGGTVCAKETGSATITPGLSLVAHNQTIVVNSALTGCAGGGVKTGTGKATLKYLRQTCVGLTKTGLKTALSETIVWNTKATSKFSGTATLGPKVGQATISGKITTGLFVGLKVKNILAFTISSALKCTNSVAIKGLKFTGVTAFSIG